MIPTITLNNGVEMPQLGLGVYAPQQNDEVKQTVLWAIEAGYRLVDTASAYRNEEEVGQAIAACQVARKELFITTKVWTDDMGFDKTLRAFDLSLSKLGVEYVDLYLIHWPKGRAERRQTWQALERIYADGRARAVGVSNYYIPHLEELFTESGLVPAVNQFEYTPYCNPSDVVEFCRRHQIQVEAYAPLVRGIKRNDPPLVEIAEHYNKSTYQILIRWGIQQNAVTIPKSTNRQRIIENADVFDFQLSSTDMETLNHLHDDTRIAWNPSEFV
jgi:methylglyoxal/glyoxal reductase